MNQQPSSGLTTETASVREITPLEALILDYIYTKDLLRETIHYSMWQQFAEEMEQHDVSPIELKVLFHSKILQRLDEYKLSYRMRRYFSGLKPFARNEVVMTRNDFLLNRNFVTELPQPNQKQVGVAVVLQRSTSFEMAKFMRLLYSCFLQGVPEGKAAKGCDIISAYIDAVYIKDIWLKRMKENSILHMASHVNLKDLIELFEDWDILEDTSDVSQTVAITPKDTPPLCSSTPMTTMTKVAPRSRTKPNPRRRRVKSKPVRGLNTPSLPLEPIEESSLEYNTSTTTISENTFIVDTTNQTRSARKRPSSVLTDPMEGTSTMYGKQFRRT